MPKLSRYSLPVLCLAGSVLCGSVLLREAGGYMRPFNTSPEFAAFMSSPDGIFGPSIFSKQIALLDCVYAMTTGLKDPQLSAASPAITAQCSKTSDEITKSMPSYGLAWYVRAISAASMRDNSTLENSLKMSQIASPQEQWLAKSRVDLGELFVGTFDSDSLNRHNADLALLLASRSHIDDVARRYQANPLARDRIMQVVSNQPTQIQSAFIRAVRRVVNQANAQPS